MSSTEIRLQELHGKEVFLPDGRMLGIVHETIIDAEDLKVTHLFVTNTRAELVEASVNLTLPWRWVRSVGDVVILRWFPKTPIPLL